MPTESNTEEYTLRISRRMIDQLGVKLYDKVAAVVSELVANSHDADATEVTVRLPLGRQLAGTVSANKDWVITVEDNGTGMTGTDVRGHYLRVGSDRRAKSRFGPASPRFGRMVMGRKGIGKLAPFGICKRIDVQTAASSNGQPPYTISHFSDELRHHRY